MVVVSSHHESMYPSMRGNGGPSKTLSESVGGKNWSPEPRKSLKIVSAVQLWESRVRLWGLTPREGG